MRTLRITLDTITIEARLLGNPTAEAICAALPFETEGALVDGGILIGSPIYVPMEDDTRKELMPGEIAFRAMDQNIVVGRAQPQGTHNSEVCMAGMVNVFAQALTELQELPALPKRFEVKVEVV